MGTLADALDDLGYEPTGKQSPFDENGTLWSNSYELVCDETALVIRKGEDDYTIEKNGDGEHVFRYRNTKNVKLYGGYTSSYEWGESDDGFHY